MDFRVTRVLAWILLVLSQLAWLAGPAAAQQLFETKAKQAYMIDAETGTVLYSKNPDEAFPPASLAKLMTLEVVFGALKAGRYTMSDRFLVSEHAWRTGGAGSKTATMFAALKSEISIENLIQGVAVQQANDGAIILAEGIAGSESGFAVQMIDRARRLGMQKSIFANPTGFTAEGQATTVRDMAILARHLWQAYPNYYRYFGQSEFTWNKIRQYNKNPLIGMDIGADGVGMGFVEGSGFSVVASAARSGKRVFVAMAGLASDRERTEEVRKLIDFGLTAFTKRELYTEDEVVAEAQVYGGAKGGVALKAKGPVVIFVPITSTDRLSARIVYDGPVEAPITAGLPVGRLKIWIGERLSQETPLYTAEDVAQGSLEQRALDAIGELIVGWFRKPASDS